MKLFSWRKRKEEAQPLPPPPAEQEAGPLGFRGAILQEQGSRERQEDSVDMRNLQDVRMLRKMGLFAVVADGMGGMRDGKHASELAVNHLCASFSQEAPLEDPAGWLKEKIFQASGQIYQDLEGNGGSTVVACLIHQEKLWFASVGDSYLFLLRDGELNQLNHLQNLRQQEFLHSIQMGSADPEAGRFHPEAEALTGFLGMQDLTQPDSLKAPMPLKPGDVLLLCSDGVGGALDETELLYCLRQGKPVDICGAIRQRVIHKAIPYQDNYTALVIQCVQ